MAKWEELPMADRAAYMRIAVKNGYRDIRSIKEVYNKHSEGGPLNKEEKISYVDPSLISYNPPSPKDVLIGEDFFNKYYRRPDGSTYLRTSHADSKTAKTTVYTAKDSQGNTLKSVDGKIITGRTQQEANNNLFWYNYNNIPIISPTNPKEALKEIVSYFPVIGEGIDIYDIYKNLENNDYTNAAIGAGLFILPNVIEKPLKKLHTFFKNRLKTLPEGIVGYGDELKLLEDYDFNNLQGITDPIDIEYFEALKNKDIRKAQELRDLHFRNNLSEVSDAAEVNGKPRLWFHGTNDWGFTEFDSRGRSNSRGGEAYFDTERGNFLSSHVGISKDYARGVGGGTKHQIKIEDPVKGATFINVDPNTNYTLPTTKKEKALNMLGLYTPIYVHPVERFTNSVVGNPSIKTLNPGEHWSRPYPISGIYGLYVNPEKTFDIDWGGAPWSRNNTTNKTIHSYVTDAFNDGFDAVRALNIEEPAPWRENSVAETLVTRNSKSMKSGLPITFDNNGLIIPLSKRDDFTNPDIRYSRGGKLNTNNLKLEDKNTLKNTLLSEATKPVIVRPQNHLKSSKKYAEGGHVNIGTSEYNPVRLPEATVIAKPKKYNHFLSTLPKNLADSDETIYRMHRYWALNGMPKDFKEAKEKGLFELQEDGKYHAFSVAYDSANDRYEFTKYPNHPKINKELDWYNNTNEGKSFQQKYHLNTIGTPYYTYERNRDAYGNPVVNWNPPGQSFPEFISDKIMMTANKLFTDAVYNEVEDPYDPGYREGIIQRSFLLPRNLQKDAILKSGHYIEGVPKDYGLVKTAVGDRDIPVYQRAKDAITRDRLVPIANPMVKNDMEDDNNYLPYELSLINAAPYPTAIYYDPSTLNTPDGIKFYQKAWDLNDYGGEGGFTSEILYGIPGLIADWVGSPVVQTTGFQPISMEHNPDIISRFLNPHMEKHSMYPYIDETTGHTYYKKGTKPITQEEEEEEDYLPVLTEQELNDHYKELGFDISSTPKNKRKRP